MSITNGKRFFLFFLFGLMVLISFSCKTTADNAAEAGTDCDETCPVGATKISVKEADGSCSADGSYNPASGNVSAGGVCTGSGSCQVVCMYPDCPEGQRMVITADSYTCEPVTSDPCEGHEDCGGHGKCRNNDGNAICDCDSGYKDNGYLECVAYSCQDFCLKEQECYKQTNYPNEAACLEDCQDRPFTTTQLGCAQFEYCDDFENCAEKTGVFGSGDDDTAATTTTTSTTTTTIVTTTSPSSTTTTTTVETTTSSTTTTIITEGFVLIPNGTFTMGSPSEEPGHVSDETQHQVTLTKDFEMSAYELTQIEFTSLLGWNPSDFGPNGGGEDCGDDCPVENVSWYDTIAYANELSLDTGYLGCFVLNNVICTDTTNVGTNYLDCMNTTQKGIQSAIVSFNGVSSVYDCEGYRLPTESEWEYAIRAGTATAFYNGTITNQNCTPLDSNLDDIGWYCGNENASTEVVGQKSPNYWGLYDMSGNVFEWVWDWYGAYPGTVTNPEGPITGSARIARGSSWSDMAAHCRSACRSGGGPGGRDYAKGFRLVRTLR